MWVSDKFAAYTPVSSVLCGEQNPKQDFSLAFVIEKRLSVVFFKKTKTKNWF